MRAQHRYPLRHVGPGVMSGWVDCSGVHVLEMSDFEHRDADKLLEPCAGYRGTACSSSKHRSIFDGIYGIDRDHCADWGVAVHRYRVRCTECGVVPINEHLPHRAKKTPQEVTVAVLTEVSLERERQDGKWGAQNHDDGKWFQILMEEVGEAAKSGLNDGDGPMREELVQVAAVAVAFIEAIDRRAS